MGRVTTFTLQEKKLRHEKITMLTAYDYSMAAILDQAGIDMLLVGDSLGNVILGYDTTLPVTMDDMVHHTKAVVRGAKNAMVVGDMPFLSYHISIQEAVSNAGRLMKEAGCHAVKLEGGLERIDTVKAILDAQIPVIGHIGLTPQSVNRFGGFKVQGKDCETAERLLQGARELDRIGVSALVMEGIPTLLAQKITEEISVPTIGIGAGPYCDGQVLVVNDLLGITTGHVPKFVKKYANIQPLILEAAQAYKTEVEAGTFPSEEHGFSIKDEVLEKLY